ncbi:MAG: cation diffusion facilitator family transporter [Gemmatimonadales bacterium]
MTQPPRSAKITAAWLSVLTALCLAILKLFTGLFTGSLAVLTSAIDSLLDILMSGINLIAIGHAEQPADEQHPYGHGKFETIGALAIVSFLSITCFELMTGAIGRLVAGVSPPRLEPVTFAVLGATMAVNLGVASAESRFAKRLQSEILAADARHTMADVLVTASVLGGLILVGLGWTAADAWLGLLVAIVIAHSGWQILRTTVPVLVDRRAIDADTIRSIAHDTPGVEAATDIRSRGRPGEAFAELTIHVHPGANVREAHEIADAVEERLRKREGLYGVVVHVEPRAD